MTSESICCWMRSKYVPNIYEDCSTILKEIVSYNFPCTSFIRSTCIPVLAPTNVTG